MATAVKKIKPVVTEKRQFECRHEPNIRAPFRIFQTIRILMKGKNPTVFHWNGLPLVESLHLRL